MQEIGENFKITARSVFYILRVMNFTFKKSHFYTKKETKMSDNNSLKKINKINKIKDKQLIYIDECGIDIEIKKDCVWSKKGEKIMAEKVGNRSKRKRISFIGALNCQKRQLFGPFYSKNYTNTDVF